MKLAIRAAALALCVACTPAPPADPPAAAPLAVEPELPRPNVDMRANPPPPFTYWAPENAAITNHPHVPGIWFADLSGERVATYFGDQCGASRYQHFVGQPLQSFPTADLEVRTSCTACPVNADLRRDRINVLFNETTQTIEQVACY